MDKFNLGCDDGITMFAFVQIPQDAHGICVLDVVYQTCFSEAKTKQKSIGARKSRFQGVLIIPDNFTLNQR